MPRYVAEHFRPDGRPKRKFLSKKSAKAYIQNQQLNCYPYLCSFCDHWHIATIKES